MKNLSLLVFLISSSNHALAVGMGSNNWGDEYPSGVDPIGGLVLLLGSIFVLLTAWVNGRSSIKSIYIPTIIGGFIIFLAIGKITFGAIVGYAILGFILGQILRFFFGHLFESRRPNPTSKSPVVVAKVRTRSLIDEMDSEAKSRYLESIKNSNAKAVLMASRKPVINSVDKNAISLDCEQTPLHGAGQEHTDGRDNGTAGVGQSAHRGQG